MSGTLRSYIMKRIICALLFLLITSTAHAINVNVSIDKNVLYIGDRANINMTINAGVNNMPVIPQVDGLHISHTGGPSQSSMQNITIINGKIGLGILRENIRYGLFMTRN